MQGCSRRRENACSSTREFPACALGANLIFPRRLISFFCKLFFLIFLFHKSGVIFLAVFSRIADFLDFKAMHAIMPVSAPGKRDLSCTISTGERGQTASYYSSKYYFY